ncbi:MAG: glycosyltransferase [Novosphingobium sp.]
MSRPLCGFGFQGTCVIRVLTFLHSFEPGGVERIALRLVRQWRAAGIDAPLFIGRPHGAMREDVGENLDFIAPKGASSRVGAYETLWMIATLPGVVQRLRPDVLFCAGNTYMVVAVALRVLLGGECPPILAKISNDLDRQDASRWGRWFYRVWLRVQGRFVDHVVGMEEPMRGDIRKRLGVPSHAITVIPDPALSRDLIERLHAAPRRSGAEDGGRRFIAVGRLAPQKNIGLMLRAFRRGCHQFDQLTIVGDGPERARLEALARRLGIKDKVTFLGYLPEPSAILPQYDILLLSSDYEGVPAVVLEALAARLTIIATDCSRSLAALLGHGMLGKLVPVGDEAALAEAISLAGPGPQQDELRLGQAERFTLERASESYLSIMSQLSRGGTPKLIEFADWGLLGGMPSEYPTGRTARGAHVKQQYR